MVPMTVQCYNILDLDLHKFDNPFQIVSLLLPSESFPLRGDFIPPFVKVWLLIGSSPDTQLFQFFIVKSGTKLPQDKRGNYNFIGSFFHVNESYLYGVFTPESAILRPEFKPPAGLVQ